jgi:CTP:molybdopterin cytidylyltransferase MocA
MLSKFSLAILAAGRAERMGFPKGLIRFNDKTLLENHIDSFFSNNGKHVHLILGDNCGVYEQTLPRLFHDPQISVIINSRIELGPFYSLQLGLKDFPEDEARFILPVDSQTPSQSVWALLAQNSSPRYLAVIPSHKNRGGHPVVVSSEYSKLLLAIAPSDEEARLDVQIRSLQPHKVKRVEVGDESILANFNSPEDRSW